MKRLGLTGKAWLEEHQLWALFLYAFFGGWTTLINLVAFTVAQRAGMTWMLANLIAWILSVLFAFVTNKLWVFHSHTETLGALSWEFAKFIFARVASLGIDYGFMFLFISGLTMNPVFAKLLTQLAVQVANYVFSKVIIFKHQPDKPAGK
ncbi:GtrA family protein [Lacticaseibacillus suibinensis]|uniref:GtrA family protein n=1 Tax=Lacticaseibacillus suibinensis TaxID=2486011 RepID=UPI001940BEB5|nr:GtrA family protein [Lacticaseibacillus suibinensis]